MHHDVTVPTLEANDALDDLISAPVKKPYTKWVSCLRSTCIFSLLFLFVCVVLLWEFGDISKNLVTKICLIALQALFCISLVLWCVLKCDNRDEGRKQQWLRFVNYETTSNSQSKFKKVFPTAQRVVFYKRKIHLSYWRRIQNHPLPNAFLFYFSEIPLLLTWVYSAEPILPLPSTTSYHKSPAATSQLVPRP